MFKFEDKRTKQGKKRHSFIARVKPEIIAKLVKEHVFAHAPMLSFIKVVLTDNGYVATKLFVRDLADYHVATVKFTDFGTTGDFADIIKPEIEKYKKAIFGKEYIDELNKIRYKQEM